MCIQMPIILNLRNLNIIVIQVNAVTGSLFTSEVMQQSAVAQEMTQEEVQEVAKGDDPAGDQVSIMQCYPVSCCVNVDPPTLRRSLYTIGVVVLRIRMTQLSTSPPNMAMSYSPRP